MKKKVMLITGTRKGIGKYLAAYYLKKEYFVIGCSRGESDIISEFYKHYCLDVADESKVKILFRDLQKDFNLTYLFISHNLKVVRKISQRIAVMYKGKIVELAPTEEIFNNPIHPYTKELLLAAIDYKAVQREAEIKIDPGAQLADHGGGHFVVDF